MVISIEGGEAAAKRTFNPHLGSRAACRCWHQRHCGADEPAGASGYAANRNPPGSVEKPPPDFSPGNYGLDYLAANYPALHEIPVVKISNFIGEALDMAAAEHFAEVLLVGHVGKLVKLAGGIMNTHSRCATAALSCSAPMRRSAARTRRPAAP